MAIAAVAIGEATELICTEAGARRPYEVHLCNSYTLALANTDRRLRSSLLRADLNLPDGFPVAFLGRAHGASVVRGADLFRSVVSAGCGAPLTHYLYGGAPGVAAKVERTLVSLYPDAQVAGTESPPFRPLTGVERSELVGRVTAARAHVVWVGLGTPRQDYLVPQLASAARCAVVPVGAAFDFLAGSVSEAPAAFRGTGAEWMYRLSQEPGRLWRRYLIDSSAFVARAAWDGWRSRRMPPPSRTERPAAEDEDI